MQSATHILGAFAARRLPDDNLFDRAIRGDAVAFSEVYRRYEKRVYGFCLARSLDREAAADATQEVFIRLLKTDSGSVEHPRAWLFAIARNVIIDSIRKRNRLRETTELHEDAPAWESMAAADTADEVAGRADAQGAFLALRRMKPRYRTALILREIHGQSSTDIAEAMGVRSTGAVDTLVSRARDAFGVAYAAVSELPQSCRHNIELMYRADGTGITPAEGIALKAHLASCDQCRREESRAADAGRLSALLPLLVPAGGAARSFLGRAALVARSEPSLSAGQHIAQLLQTHVHTLGARVAVAALAVTLVATPVVAIRAIHPAVAHRAANTAQAKPVAPSALPSGLAWHGAGPSRAVLGSHAPQGGGTSSRMPRGAQPAQNRMGATHGSGFSSMHGRASASKHGGSSKSGSEGAKGSGAAARAPKMSSVVGQGASGMPHKSGM